MWTNATGFLYDHPILLWSFLSIILLLVGLETFGEHLRRVRYLRSAQRSAPTTQPVRVFASRTDAPLCRDAVVLALQANQKKFGHSYKPSEYETAADMAQEIHLPFDATGHGLIYMAETLGLTYFDDMADKIARLGLANHAAIIRKCEGIAERLLSPDAVGDTEHPSYIAIETDADLIVREFDALDGVSTIRNHVEEYLLKEYPWSI